MMEFNFSDRMNALQPSAIREILKATAGKDVIAFSAGNPSPESFPAEEMAKIAAEIFSNNYAAALQYGITEGLPALREQTFARLKKKFSIGRDFDNLIITSGGQQAIELSTKVLVNEGDTVICEDPSFIGALNAIRSYKPNLVGVPMDEEGIDVARVEEILKTDDKVKLIYVIPTFQNPSGGVMSLARRKALLELAVRYNVMILEDNPYYELRFSGEHIPTIKSMDDTGHVIYAGSYSKIISPGMRIGFCVAPENLIQKIVVAKQVSDVHTNQFFMMLVSEYLRRCDIDAHIRGICELYGHKAELMYSELLKHNKGYFEVKKPEGGLFMWLKMPKGNGAELAKLAAARGVAVVPGSAFLADESAVSPCIRLNYSLPSDADIVRGIAILCEVAAEYLSDK